MDRSNDSAISQAEVLKLCGGKHRSWLYKKIQQGDFPPGFSVGSRSRVWWRSDVIAFLEACEAAEGEAAAARSAASVKGREAAAAAKRGAA